jgi:UDP-glucose 4-epimerase
MPRARRNEKMKVLIVGGAGFIGSHIVDYLLASELAEEVVVYDNFSAGRRWHLREHVDDVRLKVLAKDIYNRDIFEAAQGATLAIHLAANPDIAKAVREPDIDFRQGTALTQIVLEALRLGGCSRLLYASGSGVYGDTGSEWVAENFGPQEPVSTYGASKLACEALICSYAHMFDLKASAFRFGNVVGGRQTHGVAYDFIGRLRSDPTKLEIMGDGYQSKPYVYVDDVIEAMMVALRGQTKMFDAYNVAPSDFASVREIGGIVLEELRISTGQCEIKYGTTARGWKGDVPIVRLKCEKIRSMGWTCRYTSLEAVRRSVRAMLTNVVDLYTNA